MVLPKIYKSFLIIATVTLITVLAVSGFAKTKPQHNVIIFITDGLRPSKVNAQETPNLHEIRQQGVSFVNSHSLFPTFTTANASAIATGHYLGDTGDFSNTINVGFPVQSASNSPVPFLENNAVLEEISQHFDGNYLNEESLLDTAREAGFSTAAVGKVGPVLIQDVTQRTGKSTIIIDDATGSPTGIPLSSEIAELLTKNGIALKSPTRGDNGKSGNSTVPGTKVANIFQQQYFADITTKVLLPLFKKRQKPFVLIYWSRDPDGTQHNQGDSLNTLTPGINGPTSLAARQNVDNNLAQIRAVLKQLNLEASTNIFVTADHGFSTISKESKTSYSRTLDYPDVMKGFLPPGFLAIDIAHGLGLSLFDPDKQNVVVDPTQGQFSKNGLIAKEANKPDVLVAANGGSDLIYLPNSTNNKALAKQVVDILLKEDYVSGLFVNDKLGSIPGTLPLSAIGLDGKSDLPSPAIVVNFRTFDTGCGDPTACGVEVADSSLQQGQGMHGSFSRADTYNYMAAIGPDFKKAFVDRVPVSNADVAITLAKTLNLNIPHQGKLIGRVLHESLVKGVKKVSFKSNTLTSQPSTNGLKTILKYQTVGSTQYFDVAGFPGRTLGLAK
ncbi:alkaline phosphatase family protein [Nostoc punctiforme]|uniref:Type I phosphodiesterase/nucleotide pyrophosphatase n=1 Tax=Nostoc punctiforme (strain ATCC 29133 / PCC 73102) TaxID=63737 RepID=B2J0N1_NOSP7|nr:nucleotide pyrophosphatase/phosphodiesterase family protein [Nostoc punctiforme]ACC80248.1 type I phosphodiesterase/nucleotide pyrophosphatase [Nostoc punctiforme PCC 73102]